MGEGAKSAIFKVFILILISMVFSMVSSYLVKSLPGDSSGFCSFVYRATICNNKLSHWRTGNSFLQIRSNPGRWGQL